MPIDPTDKWNEIIDKVVSGIDKLTDDERVMYWVNRFLYDIESGGVSGFLYNNSSPTFQDVLTVADCLDRVGASAFGTAVRDIRELVNKPVPKAKTWGQFLKEADPAGELEERGSKLRDLTVVWQLLEKFTRERFPDG